MKINENFCVQLVVALLAVVVSSYAAKLDKVNKRQVGADKGVVLDTTEDRAAEATGFLGHGHGHHGHHSKYFQYAHVPHKDHYETGHRKGNEHHFIERHEKAHPHAGEFKTKVRWGDKHGGYGEHYWDYNHAGHGDNHDEGSEAVADYQAYEGDNEKGTREKRQPAASEQSLVLDPATGHIIDQVSGQKFVLKPIN